MKAIKILFLSAILILTHTISNGQSNLLHVNVGTSYFPNSFGYTVYETDDHNFICAGMNKYLFTDLSGELYVHKVDNSGNLVWQFSYDKPDFTEMPTDILGTADGGYIITTTLYGFFANNKTLLVKIDSTGDLIWTTETWTNSQPANSLTWGLSLELASGNIASIDQGFDNTTDWTFNIFIFDGVSGNIIDSIKLETDDYFGTHPRINRIIRTNDGGFAAIGDIDQSVIIIWKFSPDMESEGVHYYSCGDHFSIVEPLESSAGKYLLYGTMMIDGSEYDLQNFLMKVDISDPDYTYEWLKDITSEYDFSVANEIIQKADSSLIMYRRTGSTEAFFDGVGHQEFVFADKEGNIEDTIKPHYYQPMDYHLLYPTMDTSFIIVGSGFDTDASLINFSFFAKCGKDTIPECIFNCTWPGDANNDSTANMDDILSLGIAYSAVGPERMNSDDFWYGHNAEPWGNAFTDGTNYKYADCNGDGIINNDDTLAISLNYGFEHPVYSLRTTGDLPEIYLAPVVDTLPLGLVEIPVMLADDADPVELYGIKFSITYSDDEIIDSTTMHMNFDECWIGEPDDLLTMQKLISAEKTIDVGMTRIDHSDVTGSGQVGSLSFVVVDNIAGKTNGGSSELTLHISNVKANKNNEDAVLINGSDYTFKLYSGISTQQEENKFSIYPNPASTFVHFEQDAADPVLFVSLYAITGEFIKSFSAETMQEQEIYTGDLPAGQYVIRLRSSHSVFQQTLVIMR